MGQLLEVWGNQGQWLEVSYGPRVEAAGTLRAAAPFSQELAVIWHLSLFVCEFGNSLFCLISLILANGHIRDLMRMRAAQKQSVERCLAWRSLCVGSWIWRDPLVPSA